MAQPHRAIPRLWPMLALGLALGLSACVDRPGDICVEGSIVTCGCSNGNVGQQLCDRGGTWGACRCNVADAIDLECTPGQMEACPCADGSIGNKICRESSTYGSCACLAADPDLWVPDEYLYDSGFSPTPQYRFVRIDDLSETSSSEDGGADIDAVILTKATGGVFYAENVEAFMHGGFASEVDPLDALGQPDTFYAYPDVEFCDVSYGFASLGGWGGYLIVRMGAPLTARDDLTVLEVGGCDWGGGIAFIEDIQVSISVASDPSGAWLNLGQGNGPEVSFTIP